MVHEYSRLVKEEEIPLRKRLRIRILHKFGFHDERAEAFTKDIGSGPIQFFYGFCDTHGYYVDYPHGYKHELRCPECEKTKLTDQN
jgi:hypothetical protein